MTVLNLLNRDNDQLIEVRSTNIDKKRVTFHSLFYRILTPTSKNFVDLGAVVLNSPSVRTFTVDNISKKKLTLEILSSLPDEIKIYYKMEPTSPTLAINQQKNDISNKREKILETIGDKRTPKVKPNSDIDIPVTSSSSTPSNSAAEKIPSVIPLRNSNTNLSLIETKVCDSSDYLDLAARADAKKSPRRKPLQQHTVALKQLRLQALFPFLLFFKHYLIVPRTQGFRKSRVI